MSVTVKIAGSIATISAYEWASDNKSLQRVLDSMLDPLGPVTSDPDPDYSAALNAIASIGGVLISHDEVESTEGVIY
jgi:hypothetical protein